MSAGAWGTILFLIVAAIAIVGLWRATTPEPEGLPGVTITHVEKMGWNYIADDPRAMRGMTTGYPTRGAAMRAARGALKDLERRQLS